MQGWPFNKTDDLVVTGQTLAYDFPTTGNSYEPVLSSTADPLSDVTNSSFIAKFDMATPAPSACLDAYSLAIGDVAGPVSKTMNLTNCGNAPLHLSSVVSSDPFFVPSESCGTIAAGASCPVTITARALRSGAVAATVYFNDDASVPQQKLTVTATGDVANIAPLENPLWVGHQVVGATGAGATLGFFGDPSLQITSASAIGGSFSVTKFWGDWDGHMYYWHVTVAFSPQAVGPLSGTLLVASNDPVNPILAIPIQGVGDSAYQAPYIDYLSTETALINSGAVQVVIYGSNFYPSSVVNEGGTPLSTTYVSDTELQVTLPASSLTAIGQIPITVVNPLPGGASAPVSFSPYQTLLINPSALAYSSSTGLLYAAIPSYATSNPNTIIPITPSTGALGTPISVGKNPYMLSVSSDSQYLYVALATDQALQRINLKTNTVDRTFPYDPSMVCSSCGNVSADSDLQSVPGLPPEAVVGQGGKASLFNDSGLVNTVPLNSSSLAFAGNPLALYGLNNTGMKNAFNTANLTNAGLQSSSQSPFGFAYTGSTAVSDGTLLYTSTGEVWNPVTETQVGMFSLETVNDTSYPNMHSLAIDPSTSSIFAIGEQMNGDNVLPTAITAYSTRSLNLTGELWFPTIAYPDIENLVRWGTDGFAFIAAGAGLTDQELYLVRTSIVSAPTSNSVPILSSISPFYTDTPSNIARISASGLTIIANGTKFASDAVVYWNGTPLPTYFNSGAELTATAGGSLTQSPGTVQITVVNPAPGGGASNALTLTLLAGHYPAAATPSSSSLSFGNVAVGTSSSTQYISLSNNGFARLGISSITASGDFSSTSTCTTNLLFLDVGSTCEISVVFTPTTTGQRTGTITVTDDAPDSPQVISLSGTGVPAPAVAMTVPTPSPVAPGSSTTTTVTLTASGTYSGKVNLACALSSSPVGAQSLPSCSLNPTSLTFTTTGSQTTVLTINTTAASTASLFAAGRTQSFRTWGCRSRRPARGCCAVAPASLDFHAGTALFSRHQRGNWLRRRRHHRLRCPCHHDAGHNRGQLHFFRNCHRLDQLKH